MRRITALLIFSALMLSPLIPLQAQARIATLAQVVDIYDDHLSPETITIHVGEKVTWINDGEQDHTVSSIDGRFNSSQLAPDDYVTVTFPQPGTYPYICSIQRTNIKGKIIVKPEMS